MNRRVDSPLRHSSQYRAFLKAGGYLKHQQNPPLRYNPSFHPYTFDGELILSKLSGSCQCMYSPSWSPRCFLSLAQLRTSSMQSSNPRWLTVAFPPHSGETYSNCENVKKSPSTLRTGLHVDCFKLKRRQSTSLQASTLPYCDHVDCGKQNKIQ